MTDMEWRFKPSRADEIHQRNIENLHRWWQQYSQDPLADATNYFPETAGAMKNAPPALR